MSDVRFDQPVRIAVGRSRSMSMQVDRVERAELCLSDQWPAKRGRQHAAALEACRAAIRGAIRPSVARRAFEEAAMEADILLPAPPPRGVFGRRQ